MKQLEFDFSGINLLDHYKFHEVIDEGKNDLMSWSDTFSDDGEKLVMTSLFIILINVWILKIGSI